MEKHVVAKPHPSETHASTFADRPSYKWWVTWTVMAGPSCLLWIRPSSTSPWAAMGHSWDTFGAHVPLVSPITKGDTSNSTIERRTSKGNT